MLEMKYTKARTNNFLLKTSGKLCHDTAILMEVVENRCDDNCQSSQEQRLPATARCLENPDVPVCFLVPTNRDMTLSCFYGQ